MSKNSACHPVNVRWFPPLNTKKGTYERASWRTNVEENEKERERARAIACRRPGEFVNGRVRKWRDILRVDFRPAAPLLVGKEEDEESAEKKKVHGVERGKQRKEQRDEGGKDIGTKKKKERRKKEKETRHGFYR